MEASKNDAEVYTTCSEEVLKAEAKHMDRCRTEMSGLALSGGGIRSAAFALGVLQALVRGDALRMFDYMSTVSGGGFIGSALTWWLRSGLPNDQPAGTNASNFPFGSLLSQSNSCAQNKILNFLRFHGSYLVPTRDLNTTSIVAILVRNALVSLSVYLCALVIAMLLLSFGIVVLENVSKQKPLVPSFVSPLHTSVEWIHELVEGPARLDSPTDTTTSPVQRDVDGPGGDVNIIISKRIFEIVLYLCWLFLACSLIYSAFTLYFQFRQNQESKKCTYRTPESQPKDTSERHRWSEIRYKGRTNSQKIFGFFLKWIVVMFSVGFLPIVDRILRDMGDATRPWTHILFLLILFASSVLFVFVPFDANQFRRHRKGEKPLKTLGAILCLYGLLIASYALMRPIIQLVAHLIHDGDLPSVVGSVLLILVLTLLVVFLFVVGRSVNVNYLGVHRMYRDRLMEIFLPDNEAVRRQRWERSDDANSALIEEMCRGVNARPYHLINTNVVLVDSVNAKYRERGGASFVISPLYCGSDATGWVQSDSYMKRNDPGMTLATAMAISGAMANPNAGAGGSGWTRNRYVSVVMSALNLRLGYWAPHPNPRKRSRSEIPNLLWPGIWSVFLFRRLKEDYSMLDLTDAGHFENLGLYELIRRKLKLIVICDGSADIHSHFTNLATAIERVKVDFRAFIEFLDEDYGLRNLRSAYTGDDKEIDGRGDARRGFAVAQITYECGRKGVLVYIKATVTEGLDAEVSSYRSRSAAFPHESTRDQFFDEVQFEAYRELGYSLGLEAIPSISCGEWCEGKWRIKC